jgi:hypothetical protein
MAVDAAHALKETTTVAGCCVPQDVYMTEHDPRR